MKSTFFGDVRCCYLLFGWIGYLLIPGLIEQNILDEVYFGWGCISFLIWGFIWIIEIWRCGGLAFV